MCTGTAGRSTSGESEATVLMMMMMMMMMCQRLSLDLSPHPAGGGLCPAQPRHLGGRQSRRGGKTVGYRGDLSLVQSGRNTAL